MKIYSVQLYVLVEAPCNVSHLYNGSEVRKPQAFHLYSLNLRAALTS